MPAIWPPPGYNGGYEDGTDIIYATILNNIVQKMDELTIGTVPGVIFLDAGQSVPGGTPSGTKIVRRN